MVTYNRLKVIIIRLILVYFLADFKNLVFKCKGLYKIFFFLQVNIYLVFKGFKAFILVLS